MRVSALPKFLEKHKQTCTYWIFSGDRHCSCGRDAAWKEYKSMVNPIRNLRQLVLESDLDDATTEFNRLVESVAMATPYHRYVGGLSARCIHCGKKYDPKADPEDAPKHHEPGCIWLWSVELVKLCQTQ